MPTPKKTSKHWTAEEILIILQHAFKVWLPVKYNHMYSQPELRDMSGLIHALKDIRSEPSINKCWECICVCHLYRNNMHLASNNMSDSLFTAIREGFKLFHNPPPEKEETVMEKKSSCATFSEGTRFLVVYAGAGEEDYDVYDNFSQVEEVLLDEAMDRVKDRDKSPLPKVYRCTEMEVTVDMKVTIK